ncbi:hypothetical protein [Flectobacillus major]|uniref:hypothetical protein n=1 Tax=Flectobacillus major TaxID=103 RepID=UPI00118216F3|nr:hypothetical protein [Flectobacillus major]
MMNQHSRENLIKIIEKEEIYDKIVHQNIILNLDTIFESYDHMTGSCSKSSFPCFVDIIQKYQAQEVEVAELKS